MIDLAFLEVGLLHVAKTGLMVISTFFFENKLYPHGPVVRTSTVDLASGKHTKNYGKSQFSMGNSTISMAIFNGKLLLYQAG